MFKVCTHASFNRFIDLEFGVVGLGNVAALELRLVAGVGPGLVGPARGRGVGGGHLDARSGPEPSIDDGGLEVFTVTPLEIAETAAGPDVGKVLCNHLEFSYIFILFIHHYHHLK